ncbi:MAG: metallopeptidase family protein [Anaerolineae bacterium]|nr:metallopeptidase family protein [Anaerolineae bacterium]
MAGALQLAGRHAEALDALPEEIAARLENVEVVVEDRPTRQQLIRARLRRGHTLFGLYEGVPRTERTSHYGLVLPDKITIFQEPIETCCRSPQEIREQVRRTVVHEIAHHFGIDDRALREMGY